MFTLEDIEKYEDEIMASCGDKYKNAKNKVAFYKKWRSFQMSDHCPLWVELNIDFSDPFIAVAGGLVAGRGPRAGEQQETEEPKQVNAGKKRARSKRVNT